MNSMDGFYRDRLGSILVASGLLSDIDLHQALDMQRQTGKRLGDILKHEGKLSDEDITEARALQLDIPHIHLSPGSVDAEVARRIPEGICRSYQLVPVSAAEGRTAIAMADPLDVEAIDMVQRLTRCKADPLLASESGVNAVIDEIYGVSQDLSATLEEAVDSVSDFELHVEEEEQDDTDLSETRRQSEQAPIVRTVNHILKQAVDEGVSDIHLEPQRNGLQVRYRLDGALRPVRTLPRSIQAAVVSRLKIMADVDISEKRRPQDGRIAINMQGRAIDVRLSTLPTQHGERVVMRLLDRQASVLPLGQLGFSEEAHRQIGETIRKPYGIILVTGPTGNGKTTTLYSFLAEVRSPDINIITVEDPIEYEMEGVSQSAVNVRAGVTFAGQLRAILRQDPDVILVGEVRDKETADIAFRASMTGHLVFSTLHCNDAAGAFARLTDMGVEPFLISSSLSGVLAQRLVRTICPSCREQYEADAVEIALLQEQGCDLAGRPLMRGRGCKNCAETGYRGRTLVAEVLQVTTDIRRLAVERASSQLIRTQAIQEGMMDMRTHAIHKVLSGETTLDEARRKVFIREE